MDLNELISRLIILKQFLESNDRDPQTVRILCRGREVTDIQLKDDGSQQDNLDVDLV